MREFIPNARFWTWENGWVKLTLRPDQSLSHVSGGPTDEGYSWTATTWEYDGEVVSRETTTQACDCDGRLDTFDDCECRLERLAIVESFDCGDNRDTHGAVIYRPDWGCRKSGQRDYSAEAAGY